MKPFLKAVILLSLFTVLNSCNSNPLEEPITPGRRDYVWTVDTLIIPFTKLYSMSGSEPTDIWAVGPGGGLDKTIYHFDGISWKTDGISRSLSPESVFSLSKNNVWIGGQNGKIWKYDGITWKETVRFERPREKDIFFYEIWGNSTSNIIATGFAGPPTNMTSVIANYNGNKWELNEFLDLKYNMVTIRRDNQNNKYYILGIENKPDGDWIYGLFEYDGSRYLKQIYKGSNGQESVSSVQNIADKIYFGIGTSIYKYIDGEFKTFLPVRDTNFWTGFYGRSAKDIFLIMAYGIAHYDGTDIKYLFKNPNKIHILDAVIFEREVFFLTLDPSINGNLIIHGKLN